LSSILDALKRLETDGTSVVKDGHAPPAWLKDPPVEATASDRFWALMLNRHTRAALVFVVVVAVAAAAAAVWLLAGANHPQTRSPAAVPNAGMTQPEPRSVASGSRGRQGRLSPTPPPQPTPALSPPAEPAPPVRPVGETPRRPAAVVRDTPRPPVKPAVPAAVPRPASQAKPPGPVAPLPAPAPPEPEPVPLPDNAGLRLQAISWSPVPIQRIAVINNRVLYEGEPVGEFTVSAIRQEAVLLDRSNVTYRLEFQGK
jgi:outer membrane biosynthesis protein TonB